MNRNTHSENSDTNATDYEVIKWMYVGCFKIALVFVGLIVILLLIPPTLEAISRPQRQRLFCETLKPGMSIQEALTIIDQQGNFSNAQYEHNEVTTILVGPDDFQTSIKFGIRGINLIFDNEVFRTAYNYYPLGGGEPLCE